LCAIKLRNCGKSIQLIALHAIRIIAVIVAYLEDINWVLAGSHTEKKTLFESTESLEIIASLIRI
jgi:hypothetical protein